MNNNFELETKIRGGAGNNVKRTSDKFSNLSKSLRKRDVYIWGAGYYGASLYKKCVENGVVVKGYIDGNPSLEGLLMDGITICKPTVLDDYQYEKPFVVLAAPMAVDTLETFCLQKGLRKNEDFYSTKGGVEFFIDVSGHCNLSCPSCPRGNSPRNSIKGFMDLKLFEKIIDRILIDDPDLDCITLFNWGEPFLHPALADIVKIMNQKNIFSALSSHMSIGNNFDAVIKANPGWLRISVSGYYQNVYELTHTGGNIDLVKSNMYRIRYLIDKYKLDTKIEVVYHKYLNNRGDDFNKMKALCDELNFFLHDTVAFFAPIERKIDYFEHKSVAHLDELAPLYIDKSVFEIKDVDWDRAKTHCVHQTRQIMIDCNGNLQACCATYDDITDLGISYLHTPLREIIKRKLKHEFCDKCKAHGLHAWSNYIPDAFSENQ
jgi:MoaA/NifB/PqqE/SkfB family radical SAM enzyme